MIEEKTKHHKLQNIAIHWLYNQGCSVFAQEVPTKNGIADALGIRTRDKKHTTYYIEAKASRSDLICSKQRACYMSSISGKDAKCYLHSFNLNGKNPKGIPKIEDCEDCKFAKKRAIYYKGIDFYYLIVANGVDVEDDLYPKWGVLDEDGIVIRRAKRMINEEDSKFLIEAIAHVLVYKVFGKLYLK